MNDHKISDHSQSQVTMTGIRFHKTKVEASMYRSDLLGFRVLPDIDFLQINSIGQIINLVCHPSSALRSRTTVKEGIARDFSRDVSVVCNKFLVWPTEKCQMSKPLVVSAIWKITW